jgi:hypothetical protein
MAVSTGFGPPGDVSLFAGWVTGDHGNHLDGRAADAYTGGFAIGGRINTQVTEGWGGGASLPGADLHAREFGWGMSLYSIGVSYIEQMDDYGRRLW